MPNHLAVAASVSPFSFCLKVETMRVEDAVRQRKSVRAFTDQQVSLDEITAILDIARHAPSGGNLQPWKMIVLAGDALKEVADLGQKTVAANPAGEAGQYPIYPAKVEEPHRSRRQKVGEDMYAILGIAREDKFARMMQMAENFKFFGAPCAIFFVIDKSMGHGQWAHMGMLMQTICLVAEERGLATCMQEAWGMVRDTLARHFDLPDQEMIYCGMAIGYEDKTAAVNTLRTDRAALDEIVVFKGF
jgi:nitroreductase